MALESKYEVYYLASLAFSIKLIDLKTNILQMHLQQFHYRHLGISPKLFLVYLFKYDFIFKYRFL